MATMYQWQDVVFAAGQIVFTLSLLPMLFDAEKPPLISSSSTAIVLYTFAIAYASMGLWWGSVMAAIVAAMWTALFVQRLQRDEP